MSDNGKLYRKARERATELFGTPDGDLTDLPLGPDNLWSKEMNSWVFGYLFGERSAIPIKPKVLAFIAMCSASGRNDMLRRWLTAARNTGSTYEEVQEVILTTAIYGGWPVARDALQVLKSYWPGDSAAA
jgi:4-carboxymuconolactone decarboxylase